MGRQTTSPYWTEHNNWGDVLQLLLNTILNTGPVYPECQIYVASPYTTFTTFIYHPRCNVHISNIYARLCNSSAPLRWCHVIQHAAGMQIGDGEHLLRCSAFIISSTPSLLEIIHSPEHRSKLAETLAKNLLLGGCENGLPEDGYRYLHLLPMTLQAHGLETLGAIPSVTKLRSYLHQYDILGCKTHYPQGYC